MEETSLRTNLAPESLTRSFSVEVPATREPRAFLSFLLFPWFPRERSRTDQDEPEVHHVGLGGAGDDEVAQRLEIVVGVVVAQVGLQIEAQ